LRLRMRRLLGGAADRLAPEAGDLRIGGGKDVDRTVIGVELDHVEPVALEDGGGAQLPERDRRAEAALGPQIDGAGAAHPWLRERATPPTPPRARPPRARPGRRAAARAPRRPRGRRRRRPRPRRREPPRP